MLMDCLIRYRLGCRIMEKGDTESVGMHERAHFSAKIENIILYQWWKVNFPQEKI